VSETVLRDHGDELVRALAADMEQQQSDRERAEKSKGRRADSALAAIGRKHAAGRLSSGLPIKQLVGEYRALRASVLRLWAEARGEEDRDLARFHEAIDETLSESVSRYAETVTSTREQFLAILGHDLRNPLGAIAMGAELLMKNEALDDQGARVATRIYTSVQRTERLVNDLLDFARTRLGGDIPLSTRRLDLTDLCRQVVSELEAIHPACRVRLRMSGDLTGEWDGDRLAQALSNLVANAIEHGCEDGPVEVAAFGDKRGRRRPHPQRRSADSRTRVEDDLRSDGAVQRGAPRRPEPERPRARALHRAADRQRARGIHRDSFRRGRRHDGDGARPARRSGGEPSR
jgi:signal transduction histidine kinase